MCSVPDRARHIESAISTCLLAVLFLIGIGVFIKQSYYDMSRLGISTTFIELSSQPPAVTEQERPALVPLKPQGFNALSETEVYEPGNLYEKINGKAPLYIESGFVKLFTQRFISENVEDLWMELFVFDMADIRNAFSIYSVQKRAGTETLPSMQFGYKTSNGLYCVHGKYYIELLGSSESTELLKAMAQVVDKIIGNFPFDKDTKIDELALLPQDNLIPGSTKLYLANAFGFEGLYDTFTAQYKIDNGTITAFLSKQAGITEAQRMAGDYRKFLIDNGATPKKAVDQSLEGKTFDFYGTTEIVFSVGPFVGGVHEAENQRAAEKVARLLVDKFRMFTEAVSDE
jgi:hypothetical protein